MDTRTAARILDLADERARHGGSRSRAVAGFALILALAAHGAATSGSPRSAQAAAMSPAGARQASKAQAGESPEMKQLMAIGVAAAVSAGASAQDAVQWRVEDGGNGHWYAAADAATGDIALTVALSRGGNLATITSAGENAIVKGLFLATGRNWAWLGLRQLSGQSTPNAGWYWVTGEPLQYLNWTDHNGAFPTGAPDDSPCALPPWGVENDQANQGVMDQSGRWDDLETGRPTCGAPVWNNIAIIEWSADCNNDGIVDYGQIRAGQLPDANGNNIPDCCENGASCNCPADVTGNGSVNSVDLAVVLSAWGTDGQTKFDADIDDNGTVDSADLGAVLAAWGECA